jgi:hypothetical protein
VPPRQRPATSSPLPALLLVAKFAWPLIPLALYAVGSDDTPSSELTASDKRQAEEQLMARVATSAPEIERRLAQWLSARDGLLFLREPGDFEPYARHVLPAAAPWRASCGALGLTVMVGSFRTDVTEIALDERQCDELLSAVGRAMLRFTTTDDRPAQQPNERKSP